jgi:hypothetical protein
VPDSATQPHRNSLTSEHLEPWRENIVDLTLQDGTHRIGLLTQIDKGNVILRAARGNVALPDGGIIRIVDPVEVKRAPRNN